MQLNSLLFQIDNLDVGSDEESDHEESEGEEPARVPTANELPRKGPTPNVATEESSDDEEMFPETKPTRAKVFGNPYLTPCHHIS